MNGIRHTKNSKDKWGYIELCKAYISEREKLITKDKSYDYKVSALSAEQIENQWRSHLWNAYWIMYLQYKNGRKRKQCLRKMFNYWYKCPDAWGKYNEKYLDYDVISPLPMFCTTYTKSKSGKPIVFPKLLDIFKKHYKALTKKQQNLILYDGERV